MTDQVLSDAMHKVTSMMLNITLIVLGVVFVSFIIYRFLYFKLIEQGGRERIIIRIKNSDIIKKIILFFNPTTNFFKESPDDPEIKKEKEKIKIKNNDNSGQVIIKYQEKEIPFDGQRALIVWFFYKNQNEAKTFHDYNGWIKNFGKKEEDMIDYRVFRQEVKDINGRLYRESKNILYLIQKSQNNYQTKVKATYFKYLPELKKK